MQLEAQPKLKVQSIAGELAGRFQGDVIGPDHPDYAKRSIVWNAMVTKRPGLILALLTGYAQSPLIAAAKKKRIAVFTKPVAIAEVADFFESELK